MKRLKLFFDNTFKTIFSLLKVLKHKSFLTKNEIPVLNKEKIFILGNGPSLSNNLVNDLETLKDNDTFCVNSFCMSEYFTTIKPSCYIFLDPAYFKRNGTSQRFLELQDSIITSLTKNVRWKIKIFIPNKTDMKSIWYKLKKDNLNIEIIYFNNNSAHGFSLITNFLFKKNLAMPEPQNVLVGAVYLSINMKYKNIYLLGADHSWTEELRVNNKNQLYIIDKHFDSSEKKLFYKGADSKEIWRIHEILKVWSNTFQAYNELELYSKKINITVNNLSGISYIDSFKKKDIKCLKF